MDDIAPRISADNLPFLEGIYADYLSDPGSVPAEYRQYFDGLAKAEPGRAARLFPTFQPHSIFNPQPAAGPAGAADLIAQHNVDQLVRNYRAWGHLVAKTNPLGISRPTPPELEPASLGLAEADLDRVFAVDLAGRIEHRPLREIIDRLQRIYTGAVGIQFMHIESGPDRSWLVERLESPVEPPPFSHDEQVRTFTLLTDAVVLEEFILAKFVGAKSFSLEGAETLIPLLAMAIEEAAAPAAGAPGVNEIVLGMAHRGRLNVLANIVGKDPRDIFREFGNLDAKLYLHGGDVKYHQGASGDWATAAGSKVHLSLCFNPSHIEHINPVAIGRVRAKQDRAGDSPRTRKMALLIHGDAGFAGEGVVAETLNMAHLAGYTVGGTLHVILDNQIGFTTPPSQGRSSPYASDVARMLQSPIFHVNGEDPEAVLRVVRLAMDFRRTFQRDVVITMVCYRRHGHNESDEPRFTQPALYRLIDQHRSVRDGYLARLLELGQMTVEQADQIAAARRQRLEAALAESARPDYKPVWPGTNGSIWRTYYGGLDKPTYDVPTGVPRDRLAELLRKLSAVPEGFRPHRTVQRFLHARAEMAEGTRAIDWSAAEALALATLAAEGRRIRFAGQDTERGTFSQRHAVLHDSEDDRTWTALTNLSADQGPVEIVNSPLSELAALGFEYGYSLDCPEGLVAWEAQFGDFVNAAQVVIDQFIASAQDKWCRLSGLVLLLPHGLEGAGAEHSSARLERFLQLAADDNFQVIFPTTAAQFFHVLRRQVLRVWRKPMIVLTPKSLLRAAQAASPLDDLAAGQFQRVIGDARFAEPASRASRAAVNRLILCSGKVYFELESQREKVGRTDVAIIRVEQLYPLPTTALADALAGFRDEVEAVWVQEEPANMGAWSFLWTRFGPRLLGRFPLRCVSRPEMTTPASGSAAGHALGQEQLLKEAFG